MDEEIHYFSRVASYLVFKYETWLEIKALSCTRGAEQSGSTRVAWIVYATINIPLRGTSQL